MNCWPFETTRTIPEPAFEMKVTLGLNNIGDHNIA
jgi:hypothetical protein